jgi:hypothetical protein
LQIVHQRLAILPVDERARPRDRCEPLADFLRKRSRRFAVAFPSLISISSAASRAAPRDSRLPAFRVFFEAMPSSLFQTIVA